jgi:hypothetical protein
MRRTQVAARLAVTGVAVIITSFPSPSSAVTRHLASDERPCSACCMEALEATSDLGKVVSAGTLGRLATRSLFDSERTAARRVKYAGAVYRQGVNLPMQPVGTLGQRAIDADSGASGVGYSTRADCSASRLSGRPEVLDRP